MNDSKNSSNGLLVLTTEQSLSKETEKLLRDKVTPLAETLGLNPMVLADGLKLTLQIDHTPLLRRIADALEALVAQGQPPEVSEAQIAPQALNARSTGLNSRAPHPEEDINWDKFPNSFTGTTPRG